MDKNSLAQPFDDKDCENAEEKDVGKSSHLFKSPSHLACAHMPNANEFGHSQASNLSCSVSAGIKVNQFRRYLVAKMLPLPTAETNWTLWMLVVSSQSSSIPPRRLKFVSREMGGLDVTHLWTRSLAL